MDFRRFVVVLLGVVLEEEEEEADDGVPAVTSLDDLITVLGLPPPPPPLGKGEGGIGTLIDVDRPLFIFLAATTATTVDARRPDSAGALVIRTVNSC